MKTAFKKGLLTPKRITREIIYKELFLNLFELLFRLLSNTESLLIKNSKSVVIRNLATESHLARKILSLISTM